MTVTRLDLPPIARQLNNELINGLDFEGLDAATAAAITELSTRMLNTITALENDLIISKARSARLA